MMTRRQRITQVLTLDLAAISFGRLVAVISGVVVLGGAVGGAARYVGHFETKQHADSTYVRRDSFVVFQAGDAAVHQRDSLIIAATIDALKKDLSRLVVACERKGDCR